MLNIENSALIIIDLQEKLVNAVNNGAKAVECGAKLANTAKILDIPVIVTEQYPKGLGETVDGIKKTLPENTIRYEKSAFSALKEPEILKKITNLKPERNQIAICGAETHICVYQTVCDLIEKGFEVYTVKDGCASRTPEDYRTGLDLMKDCGAKITCTETVIFEWLKTSKHPKFKEVQALIK